MEPLITSSSRRRWLAGWIVLICVLLFPHGITFAQQPWTDYRLIAHGLGEISSVTVTNSREAFVTSYEKGHRVFEADLILTQDEQLVARHDWTDYLSAQLDQPLAAERKDQPMSFQTFYNTPILKQYTPLSYKDLVLLLKQYPDAYLVTDTKETDPENVDKQFRQIVDIARSVDPAILDRIVPELYSPEMIKQVQQMYRFPSYLFSLYLSSLPERQVVDYVRKNSVQAVAMPLERANERYVRMLNEAGSVVYVHTTNDQTELVQLERMGVHGFYTDRLDYRQAALTIPAPEMKVTVQQDSQVQDARLPEPKPGIVELLLAKLIHMLNPGSTE